MPISESPLGSLSRASILLRAIALGSSKGSLLTELVAKTALPRPTIHRVLGMLIEMGWVIRDHDTSRFNLGMDLAALGFSAIARNPIERIAATHLALLAGKINQVVYLNVRSGLDTVCIGRYESESQIQVGRGRMGQRAPFGLTPSCMAMLARLSKEEQDLVIGANLSRYHRIQGFDEIGFRQAIHFSLVNGYGSYDGIMLDHTTSGLGVAIVDKTGYPLAGIGTTYITGWLDEEKWHHCLNELQNTAANIAQHLMSIE